MQIKTIIDNLETLISGKNYFQDVFTFPKWNTDKSPFCVILDSPSSAVVHSNHHIGIDTNIDIYICVRYDVVEGQTDDAKMEEAYGQIRELYDSLKVDILKNSTFVTIGSDFLFGGEFVDDYIQDVNIVRRKMTIRVKELVDRR
jgi:hypothetical protein